LLVLQQTLYTVHLYDGCDDHRKQLHPSQLQHLALVTLLPLQKPPLPLVRLAPRLVCLLGLLEDGAELLGWQLELLVDGNAILDVFGLLELYLHVDFKQNGVCVKIGESYDLGFLFEDYREGASHVDFSQPLVGLADVRLGLD